MVTVIFANLKFKETFEKANKFIKNNRMFKYAACCSLAFAATVMTVAASGVTVGYTVSYSDKVIAVVSSEADYNEADAIVSEQLDEETAKQAAISPEFGITLTVKDKLNNTQEIVDAIIDNNDDITEGYALFVNGNAVACVKDAALGDKLTGHLAKYYINGAENTAKFVDDVKVQKGYFLNCDMVSLSDANDIIGSLDVKTVSVVTKKVTIPHETKNIKTNKKTVGYSAVTTKGVDGVCEKTEEIVKINGKVVSKTSISEKIVKKQVTEVITIGTGVKYVSAKYRAKAAAADFICPIARNQFVVSAYYGDGRNHKGIDLAADCGTPIFATAAGKVTFSGWDGDYGYTVIIQHSNGMKTRYAHANALCVKTGATVAQGEMIATVGSTGWSTGNHLHFEVIVNGNRVNPGPYIGLN